MKLRKVSLWCCVVLLWTCSIAIASADSHSAMMFRTIDAEHGLSQNTVFSILQDKLGRIWIATKAGVNIYNGSFFSYLNNTNSNLQCDYTTTLFQDKEGLIWIGTNQGLYYYNPVTEEVYLLSAKTSDGTSVNGRIRWINCNGHNLLVSSEGQNQGLFVYNKSSHTLSRKLPKKFSDNCTVWTFLQDKQSLWLSIYGNDVYILNANKKLTKFADSKGNDTFKGQQVQAFCKMQDGNMLIGSSKGLYFVDYNHNVKQLNTLNVRCITRVSSNTFWIGTDSGLLIYEALLQQQQLIKAVPGDQFSLQDDAIYAIFKDNEGNMWVGSWFGGIAFSSPAFSRFVTFQPFNSNKNGRRIRSFCNGGNGFLYYGTEDDGLYKYEISTSLIQKIHGIECNNIQSLCNDSKNIWVGTFNKGLYRLSISGNLEKVYRASKTTGLDADFISAIYNTPNGELYVGTTSGLYHYKNHEDRFVRIPNFRNFVYDIIGDKDGKLWIAAYNNGIYEYDITSGKFIHYLHNSHEQDVKKSTSLPGNMVIDLYLDQRNRLWVLTQGNGIALFNRETRRFKSFQLTPFISSNTAYSIQEGAYGLFWISTNDGLLTFSPEKGFQGHYTIGNGLPTNQFNYLSSWHTNDGTLYFGSINGFVKFVPASFNVPQKAAQIVLSDLLIGEQRVKVGNDSPLKKSISLTDEIILNYNDNNIQLSAALINYIAPEANRIVYKLDGVDNNWHKLAQNGVIHYLNLQPGHYTLHVKGTDADNVNTAERTLDIIIRPPFYDSWIAWILYFIIIITGSYTVYLRIKRKRAFKQKYIMEKLEQEKEREIYQSKINFFTKIAHEIRTPLTLIKSPLEDIMKNRQVSKGVHDELAIIDTNTKRLTSLVNQLLDFRKVEAEEYKPVFKLIDVSKIIKSMLKEFKSLFEKNGIVVTTNIPEHMMAKADQSMFTKILSNLFSNASKYASSKLDIQVYTTDHVVKIELANDGTIIPLAVRNDIFKPYVQYKNTDSSHPGTGIGLALARSFAELNKGSLYMDDDTSLNRFILTVPRTDDNNASSGTHPKEHISINPAHNTLLLVDDDTPLRLFVGRMLQKKYNVIMAADGEEALRYLSQYKIHLVITDVMMPGIDGLELCRRIKENRNYSYIPVIMFTAKASTASQLEGIKNGADAYIEKPFSNEFLLTTIDSLLKSRKDLYDSYLSSPIEILRKVENNGEDETFIKELHDAVQENLDNSEFGQAELADTLGLSRASLYRKMKTLVNMTPNEYINNERLNKAASLLKDGKLSVNEICFQVGFNTPSYFARCFYKKFGCYPKDFNI